MKLEDLVRLGYRDLAEKRVRTALTIIMVVIGVAAIVALVSLTEGISASISSELSSLGPTTIILSSTSSAGFTSADTSQISTLPNVNTTIPILEGSVYVLANNQNSSATLIGISPQDLQPLLGAINLYQGAEYQDTIAPEALSGYTVAFPTTASRAQSVFVGQPVTVKLASRNGNSYTVPIVGILLPYGSSLIPVDSGIFMSLPAAETLLGKSSFNIILVKASSASTVPQLATLLSDVYGSKARIFDTQQIAQTANQIIGTISLFLIMIAGISLIVAAIGIMNIMLIAVYERTHEIGILKSVGFKNKDVLSIFMIQALIIGFVGGVIGIAAGMAGPYILTGILSAAQAHAPANSTASGPGGGQSSGGGGGFVFSGASGSSSSPSIQPVFSVETMVVALVVALLVSLAAGVYPAWRASKLEPIDALRQL
jgi:ABC-type antimicrobial peptide transport system permease subunit